MPVEVRLDGATASGDALDLRATAVDAAALVAAVRDPDDDLVRAPPPGPAHEHVGHVRPGMGLRLRAAVAAAARSAGATTPVDRALAAARADLADVDVPSVDLAAARRRVAEAGADESALRERVARLGGRVEASRDAGDGDAGEAGARLREAARRLSEAETERLAAEQALARARERARQARDARERRLRLTDRVRSLRREARGHLLRARRDAFADALAAVPGGGTAPGTGDSPDDYDGDPVTAALAVARMADLSAPVVLACDRFDAPADARDCLDAPVVLARPGPRPTGSR